MTPTKPADPEEGCPVECRPCVGVVGASDPSDHLAEVADALGEALARQGAVVVTGGLGGVMEAASRGAARAGGLVIGVLPGNDPADANPWVHLPLPTGLGEMRNALVVRFVEAVVAVGGGWGTLSEVALAARRGTPVGVLSAPLDLDLPLPSLSSPAEAAAWAVGRTRSGSAPGTPSCAETG